MITCSVCNTTNHHLNIICKQCGAYIQIKIENIDLFQTLWLLIEHPSKAFKQIAISKHKNYIIFLTSLFGMSFLFLLFEYINIGRFIGRGILIATLGIGGGIFLGFILISLLTLLTLAISKLLKSPTTKYWNLFSVIAYSTVPIVYIFVFLLPIKLLTFGVILYTSNPSPILVNASVHYIVLFLEVLLFVWFAYLFTIACSIVFEFKYLKSFTITSAILITFGIALVLSLNHINSLAISTP